MLLLWQQLQIIQNSPIAYPYHNIIIVHLTPPWLFWPSLAFQHLTTSPFICSHFVTPPPFTSTYPFPPRPYPYPPHASRPPSRWVASEPEDKDRRRRKDLRKIIDSCTPSGVAKESLSLPKSHHAMLSHTNLPHIAPCHAKTASRHANPRPFSPS